MSVAAEYCLWEKHRPMASIMLLVMILALLSFAPGVTANTPQAGNVADPGADLWRAVRQRESAPDFTGVSQVSGSEAAVLINAQGEWWRRVRSEQIIPYGAMFLGAVLAVIALWFLLRGRIRLQRGRSGKRVPRFSLGQRIAHWFLVALFLLLAVTGLILLYGREALIPLFGEEVFGIIASASKEAHNLFGPIFPFAVLAVIFLFIRGNGFSWVDLKWVLRGGGMLGWHASAGRYNAGEKLWFWAAILLGLSLSVSGLILDFPIFGLTREWMEWSLIIHGISALLMVAGLLGHVYIATIGMEGALESMTDGRVDANWAKEHHDLWYEEIKEQTETGSRST
jgi:formate dehydrogenase subunit gamma